MYGNNKCMIIFGSSDLQIAYECNSKAESSSNLGECYQITDGFVNNSYEANSYLAGSHNFKVREIEVYKI